MRTVVILLATAFLAACAGSPVQTTRSSLQPSEYELDRERINAVERQARMNWGRVYWVSLPRKKVEPVLVDQN